MVNKQIAEVEDRWLSVDEIGKYLGVSSDTVYRWIDKQGMPAHRLGRRWKFKIDELDAWVKAGGAAEPAPPKKSSKRSTQKITQE